jgi:hypothetical protein
MAKAKCSGVEFGVDDGATRCFHSSNMPLTCFQYIRLHMALIEDSEIIPLIIVVLGEELGLQQSGHLYFLPRSP